MRYSTTTVVYTDRELDRALSEVAAAGFEGIELQPHLTIPLLSRPAREVDDRLAAHGLQLAACMVGFLDSDAGVDLHRRALAFAARHPGSVVVTLPPKPGPDPAATLKAFERRLRTVGAMAEQEGGTIAVHHHTGTVIDTPATTTALVKDLPAGTGLCFDTAHFALYAPADDEAVSALGPRIAHVHLKDLVAGRPGHDRTRTTRSGQQSFRGPGDGALPLDNTVQSLARAGYTGWVSAEIENFNRPRPDALRAALDWWHRQEENA